MKLHEIFNKVRSVLDPAAAGDNSMNNAAIITTVRHVETVKPPAFVIEPPREHWCLHLFSLGSWSLRCYPTEADARDSLKWHQKNGERVMPHIYKITLSEPVS